MDILYFANNRAATFEIVTIKKSYREYLLKQCYDIQLPLHIRLEKNFGYNSIRNAEYLLKFKDKSKWPECSISGLRPTHSLGYFYSDFIFNGKKILFVAFVSPDKDSIFIKFSTEPYPKNSTMRAAEVDKIMENMVLIVPPSSCNDRLH